MTTKKPHAIDFLKLHQQPVGRPCQHVSACMGGPDTMPLCGSQNFWKARCFTWLGWYFWIWEHRGASIVIQMALPGASMQFSATLSSWQAGYCLEVLPQECHCIKSQSWQNGYIQHVASQVEPLGSVPIPTNKTSEHCSSRW